MPCPGVSAPLAEHTFPPTPEHLPPGLTRPHDCLRAEALLSPFYPQGNREVLGAGGGGALPAALHPPNSRASLPVLRFQPTPRGLAGAVAAWVSGVWPPPSEASLGVQGSPGSKAGARGLVHSKPPLNL